MAVNFERAYWEGVDNISKLALHAIRDLIDYLEGVKRELCLESTKLSTDDSVEFLGPATEVALVGLVHAIDYLSICRTRINNADVALAKRFLTKLDAEQG